MLFPGSDLCSLLQLTNLSLSLSLSLSRYCCFVGRSALCQDIMPSLSTCPHQGLSSGNRWGRRPFPCPSKTAESSTLRAHLHIVALPETSHPWQGAHSAHTSHSRSKRCLMYLLYPSNMSQCSLPLSCEGGWVTQCYALLHRGGGSALPPRV